MKTILVISDTHRHSSEDILHHAKQADEIWHAGDMGNVDLCIQMHKMGKTVRGVYGNIDGQDVREHFKEILFFEIEGLKVLVKHIVGYPKRYRKGIAEILNTTQPNIFVAGHSHILKIARDKKYNNLIFINPGAAGVYGMHKQRTMVRFKIDNGKVFDMVVIDLGLRSKFETLK